MQKFVSSISIPLKEIISTVSYSNIDRNKEKGIISLFMCHVSPKCKSPILKKYKDFMRIDIHKKDVKMWKLIYNPKKPDVIIKDLVI